jgi:hypothetical protein
MFVSCSWLAAASRNVQLPALPHAVWHHQAAQRGSSSSVAQLHRQQHQARLVGREVRQQRLPDTVERRVRIQCRNWRRFARLCADTAKSGNTVERDNVLVGGVWGKARGGPKYACHRLHRSFHA